MNIVRRPGPASRERRVVVIGAGVGGLSAAIRLAARGLEVTVVEKAGRPGGKLRQVHVGGAPIDAGPTVFTLRHVFDGLFAEAGSSLEEHLTVRPVGVLARHAWPDGGTLDLFADMDRSADAIAQFAGSKEAKGYLDFCRRAGRIYRSLDEPFIRAAHPSLPSLMLKVGRRSLRDLLRISPYGSLWYATGNHFRDPRLRQLFARYATYCGSSPFRTPATLMLVAHVEQQGVWLIDGGMYRLVEAMTDLAGQLGVRFVFGQAAAKIETAGSQVSGVQLEAGDRLPADAVVVNADAAAVAAGLLGTPVRRAVRPYGPRSRSMSALTLSVVAETRGFPLIRHTVFFGEDYRSEFRDIFRRRRLPAAPTVYVCAQDRADTATPPPGPERLLCVINGPPTGDTHTIETSEIEQCESTAYQLMEACGLQIDRSRTMTERTTPTDFNRLFPATGGALYGRVSHGWRASFQRPGVRTRIPGLYLAGGSTHPGPGVPMAAMSGQMAASCLLSDLASTSRSRTAAIAGGTSTPSATTGSMPSR